MKQASKTDNSPSRFSRLFLKAGAYLRRYGLSTTLRKVCLRLARRLSQSRRLQKPLFTLQELEAQRGTKFPKKLVFSILVPLYNTPETFLREMISSVQSQTYGGWELCLADGSGESHPEVERICQEYASRDPRIRYHRLEKNLGISGNTNACLELASGNYISLFDHDDLLHPAALFEIARTVNETGADFVYTDEALFSGDIRHIFATHCKPEFFPDYLRGNNFICHFTSFSRELLEQVGLFRPEFDGSQDHDFVLRATEKAKKIVHIPEILYYWRSHPGSVAEDIDSKRYAIDAGIHAVEEHLERMGIRGQVESTEPFPSVYRIRYDLTDRPLVSIVIAGAGSEQLRRCLEAVEKITTYKPVEILVSGPDSQAIRQSAVQFPGVRFLPLDGPFRIAAAYNNAVSQTAGSQLLFLDSSCEPTTPDWIQELLMYAQRKDVGVVAGKIFDSKYRIAHAGLILGYGPCQTAACPFLMEPDGSDGYNGRLYYAQEFQAVSPECMMIPRTAWEQAGGFRDYALPDHIGADLCLRIRNAGRKVLWTPCTILKQVSSSSRRISKRTAEADAQRFREAWSETLQRTDPFYNPSFRKTGPGFWLK